MKEQYLLMGVVGGLLTMSCSSPKYTYNFDHYDYTSGRKSMPERYFVQIDPTRDASPLIFNDKELLASSSPGAVAPEEPEFASVLPLKERADQHKNMSKGERKNFRKELKREVRNYANDLKSGDHGASITATKELDDELKLAIIFGAIGITLTVLGGINTVFWVLGVVGLVIGLVFFIRWISRQ